MIGSRSGALPAGGLHAAHRARLNQDQGPPALTLVESATLLGADPPHKHPESRTNHQPVSATGSRMRNVVPEPRALETSIAPPLWRITLCASERPSPVPPAPLFVVKKGWKTRS